MSFPSPHKVSVVKSYVDAMHMLSRSLHAHHTFLSSRGHVAKSVPDDLRENIRNNAAAATAMALIVQREFRDTFDAELYDHDRIDELEKQVREIKRRVLNGEIEFSRDQRFRTLLKSANKPATVFSKPALRSGFEKRLGQRWLEI